MHPEERTVCLYDVRLAVDHDELSICPEQSVPRARPAEEEGDGRFGCEDGDPATREPFAVACVTGQEGECGHRYDDNADVFEVGPEKDGIERGTRELNGVADRPESRSGHQDGEREYAIGAPVPVAVEGQGTGESGRDDQRKGVGALCHGLNIPVSGSGKQR